MITWKDNRAFASYLDWECWQAGMYRNATPLEESAGVCVACSILGDTVAFLDAAMRVVDEWTTTSAVHLSNSGINRRAWLGRASCCLVGGVPEQIVRTAWWRLTVDQQAAANAVADRIIDQWKLDNCQTQSSQLEFQF